MKKINFLLFFGLLILGGGCCKEELPGGYDYKFSCKINGVPWEAKYREHEGSFSRNDLDVSVFKLQDTAVLQIIATNAANGEGMNLSCIFSDTIKFCTNYPQSNLTTKSRCGGENFYLDKGLIAPNTIYIASIDDVSHTVKGTFSFKLISNNLQCIDTLNITEGFFDVKY